MLVLSIMIPLTGLKVTPNLTGYKKLVIIAMIKPLTNRLLQDLNYLVNNDNKNNLILRPFLKCTL